MGDEPDWGWGMSFFCYDCQFYKPIEEMHKINSPVTKRGRCKLCHNAYTRNYHLIRRSRLMPQNFMECDDCDRIFSKFAPGSKNLLAEYRKLRIECPFCQSEEIDSFKPELKKEIA